MKELGAEVLEARKRAAEERARRREEEERRRAEEDAAMFRRIAERGKRGTDSKALDPEIEVERQV